MRRVLGFTLAAALAVTGLTACMSDDNESARGEGRAAALVPIGQASAKAQLTIDGITPAGQAIDVQSYSWSGQAPPGAVAQFGELTITKELDETSPKLFESIALGRRFAAASLKLYATPGGGPSVNYVIFTLQDGLVTGIKTAGNADSAPPSEEVTLNYARIRQETRNPDLNGVPGPWARFGWDVQLRRPW